MLRHLLIIALSASPLLAADTSTVIGIIGNSPAGDPQGNLGSVVAEINLLHPAAVLGSLIPTEKSDAPFYAIPEQPPIALITDHPPPLKAVPNRYRSVEVQNLHICLLDSEESDAASLSNDQLSWLASDLNTVFTNRKCGHVVLVMHRSLWKVPESNWKFVQQLLVAFNRRPIVGVEGLDDAPVTQGPRVDTVIATDGSASSDDGVIDGVHYFRVGTGGGKVAGEIESLLPPLAPTYALLRVDDHGPHVAMVKVGSIHPPGLWAGSWIVAGTSRLTLVPDARDLLRFNAWAPELDLYAIPDRGLPKKP